MKIITKGKKDYCVENVKPFDKYLNFIQLLPVEEVYYDLLILEKFLSLL